MKFADPHFTQLAQASPTPVPSPAPTPSPAGKAGEASGSLIERVIDLIDLGGPIVVILAVLSIAALAIMILKLVQFMTARPGATGRPNRALTHWSAGRTDEAMRELGQARTPLARVLRSAMGLLTGGASARIAREEAARVAADELKALSAWLRGLEIIATMAPLLGLLGTVIGMIIAFQDLQASGERADPNVLAGGIWQALLTTAVGLSIAVTITLVLSWFESVVDRTHHTMEDALTRVFTSAPFAPAGSASARAVTAAAAATAPAEPPAEPAGPSLGVGG